MKLLSMVSVVSVFHALTAAACEKLPEPVRDIEANRFYVDAASSIVDPALKAKKDAAVRPLKDFLRAVSTAADRYAVANDRESARCALEALRGWAEGDAMLGTMSSRQADYERKWMLAGLAIAYLKVRPEAQVRHRSAIEPWLDRVAFEVRRHFDDPGHARNNHYYWAGLAVGATAAGTGSPSHWEFARQVFRDATAAIRPDGTLQLELARQKKALWYHGFALAPLVVLAEIAAARGEDWYAMNGGALHRLVERTLDGISHPESFERLSGYPQDGFERGELSGDILGWIEPYARRFPDKDLATWRGTRRRYIELGGDLTNLPRTVVWIPRS